MRKKRIMVIGARNCGKTSLVNYINEYDGQLRKTQDTIYGKHTIDVPAAYIENSWMYMHTIAMAQDASCVLMMVDQARCDAVYSPGFAKVFRCPVIGVINKIDMCPENRQLCIKQMEFIGIDEPYFPISIKNGEGFDTLKIHLYDAGYIST